MGSINITIKFFASIREILGENEKIFLLPEGSNVERALMNIKNQYPDLAKIIDCSFIALNEEYALGRTLIKEGDTLAIIPPVSGG